MDRRGTVLQPRTISTIDRSLCSILANQSVPARFSNGDFDALWDRSQRHGTDALIADVILRSEGVPEGIRREAARRLSEAKLVGHLQHVELRRVLNCLGGRADVLLLKGAGLAYVAYREPHLRPRLDVDLFVRRDSVDRIEGALAEYGYERAREADAELISSQRHFRRIDPYGMSHFIDLHWQIANPQLFTNVLSFDDAWRSCIPVAELVPSARTLGGADALLVACVHRVAHHGDTPLLIWLWDIHLLASRLTSEEWRVFVERAEITKMQQVTLRGLLLARDRFAAAIPADVLERLSVSVSDERMARFMTGDQRLVDIALSDLGALASWRKRLILVRELLFPPPAYMRARYPSWPRLLLPLSYLYRIARGAPKWLHRPPPDLR